MMADRWQADPARGEQYVAPKAAELITEMQNAADVALAVIDANEREAIKRIKEEAGQKRAKVTKAVSDMQAMEPMRLVRKFWHTERSTIWQHFLGDQTKVGGIE